MAIANDESGFLVGERRLKELNKEMGGVRNDTSEILSILKSMIQIELIQRDRNQRQSQEISNAVAAVSKARPKVSVTINTGATKVTRNTTGNITVDSTGTGSRGGATQTKNTSRQTSTTTKTVGQQSRDASGRFTAKTTNVAKGDQTAARDANGRFTGKAQGINEKTFFDNLKRGIDSIKSGPGPDVSNLDPTVDAVRELTSVFAPAHRAFQFMGRGAAWLFKKGKAKRAEDIPRVQQDHNTEVERHNYEERKLLRKLIDAVNRKAGGSLLAKAGLGSLIPDGGRNGKNGKNGRNAPTVPVPDKKNPTKPRRGPLGKLFGGLRGKAGILGTLLGGAYLASNWDDMDSQEKGGNIGSMIGGGVGGFVGSLAGPVGTVGGGVLGSMLGDRVGQKVGQWADTLQKKDVGGAIVNGWNDTLDGINKMVKGTWSMSKFGLGMMGGGFGGGFMQASFRRGNNSGGGGYSTGDLSGGTPSDYNPNNEIPITKVLETGKGYNIVELADGSVIRQDGNWNWRNRNAGNVEDGDYAKSKGRLSQSDAKGSKDSKRFAAFPTFAAGQKAKRDLIFEGKNYRDLDLMGAIARYAPIHENDTPAYQRAVMKAVGVNKRMGDYTERERDLIMGAIQKQEGSLKQGKVTVIKPPTKNYDASKPAQQQNTKPTAKPLMVSAKPANQTQPLYATNSPGVKAVTPPASPNVVRRESGQQQPMLMASAAQDNISQGPADRDLFHAVTGGIGLRTLTA